MIHIPGMFDPYGISSILWVDFKEYLCALDFFNLPHVSASPNRT
jgi:hypothetical protein